MPQVNHLMHKGWLDVASKALVDTIYIFIVTIGGIVAGLMVIAAFIYGALIIYWTWKIWLGVFVVIVLLFIPKFIYEGYRYRCQPKGATDA